MTPKLLKRDADRPAPQRASTSTMIPPPPPQSPVSPSIMTLLNPSSAMALISPDTTAHDFFINDDNAAASTSTSSSSSTVVPSLSWRVSEQETMSQSARSDDEDGPRAAKRGRMELDEDYDEESQHDQEEEEIGDMAPPSMSTSMSMTRQSSLASSHSVEQRSADGKTTRPSFRCSSSSSSPALGPISLPADKGDARMLSSSEDVAEERNGNGNGNGEDAVSPDAYAANSPLPVRRIASPPRPRPRSPPPPPPPPPSRLTTAAVASMAAPTNRLEKSMFGVEPIDEFTKEVADWIWGFCQHLDRNVVEIEAKIGILMNRHTNQRFHSTNPIESIITDDSGLRFDSNMTESQHRKYNQLLNSRVDQCGAAGYVGSAVRYHHSRDVDSLHAVPGSSGKTRVTRDQKDGQIKAVIAKERMADMNIHSPKRVFDWRISISVERPAALPTSPADHTRFKDRVSYAHQIMQVDLTKVTASAHADPRPSFELEVEIRDAKVLLKEAEKEARGEENVYLDMVQAFLNNIRLIIRNA